jgi:hypothetical protein
MTEEAPPTPEEEDVDRLSCRLESWKEIAVYLKRGVRTVQRWERTEALPVHRHHHDKRGTVYAFRREIDDWRENRGRGMRGAVAGNDASAAQSNRTRTSTLLRKRFWRHRKARLAVLILSVLAAAVAWIKIQGAVG